MDGAQAIFAFHGFDGIMTTFTSPVTYDMSSEFSNSVMIIYATIEVPDNRTRVNHVWQASDIFSNGLPAIHATSGRNVQSKATLNLLSGQSSSVGNSRMHRKNTHGVLNAVSWGILMPIGAIIVRYMRVLKSTDPG